MATNEKRSRHIVKTITWRITATTTTILIAWLITGNLEVGLAVGGIEAVAKMFLYYLHERAWSKSDFGTVEATSE